MLFDADSGGTGPARARWRICSARASEAVDEGYTIIILSDRGVNLKLAPIPSLLATAGVHHHLVREGTRNRAALVIESGDAREVHHLALLIGYGAGAVNPYLAFETLDDMIRSGMLPGPDAREGRQELHQGAQQGRAEGDVQDGHLHAAELPRRADFRGGRARQGRSSTATSPGRRRASAASASTRSPKRCARATSWHSRERPVADRDLDEGGEYQWRRDGEFHLFNPDTVYKLQHADAHRAYQIYKEYTQAVNEQTRKRATLRGLFELKLADHADSPRRGRAGRQHPQAVRDRRDVLRIDQPGSARDARDRDEPPRRQVEHGRRRRRSGALCARCERRLAQAAPSSRSPRRASA